MTASEVSRMVSFVQFEKRVVEQETPAGKVLFDFGLSIFVGSFRQAEFLERDTEGVAPSAFDEGLADAVLGCDSLDFVEGGLVAFEPDTSAMNKNDAASGYAGEFITETASLPPRLAQLAPNLPHQHGLQSPPFTRRKTACRNTELQRSLHPKYRSGTSDFANSSNNSWAKRGVRKRQCRCRTVAHRMSKSYAQAAGGLVSCDVLGYDPEERGQCVGAATGARIGEHKTAWTWLHKLRRAMVRPRRDRLRGRVEVDETYTASVDEERAGDIPDERR